MDMIAWNIQRGGRSRLEAIESELVTHSPDVIVLGEYVRGTTDALIDRLAARGWTESVVPESPERRGGVAIVSRLALERRAAPPALSEVYRYAAIRIPAMDLDLCGVYAPLQNDPYQEFWESLLDSLSAEADKPVVLLGDLNACLPLVDTSAQSLFSAKYFRRLLQSGYVDLWRAMNAGAAVPCTWKGRIHPYRLDHAFGTASAAARVRSCCYDHTVRLSGLSDHSMLLLSIEPG